MTDEERAQMIRMVETSAENLKHLQRINRELQSLMNDTTKRIEEFQRKCADCKHDDPCKGLDCSEYKTFRGYRDVNETK